RALARLIQTLIAFPFKSLQLNRLSYKTGPDRLAYSFVFGAIASPCRRVGLSQSQLNQSFVNIRDMKQFSICQMQMHAILKHIVHDAIATGKLRHGKTVFEATSGNFGIALGQISRLGLDVVALVSRKLQEGVFEELGNERTRIIHLDMDICPAPGMKGNATAM